MRPRRSSRRIPEPRSRAEAAPGLRGLGLGGRRARLRSCGGAGGRSLIYARSFQVDRMRVSGPGPGESEKHAASRTRPIFHEQNWSVTQEARRDFCQGLGTGAH